MNIQAPYSTYLILGHVASSSTTHQLIIVENTLHQPQIVDGGNQNQDQLAWKS